MTNLVLKLKNSPVTNAILTTECGLPEGKMVNDNLTSSHVWDLQVNVKVSAYMERVKLETYIHVGAGKD